jgi:hypothetical protein
MTASEQFLTFLFMCGLAMAVATLLWTGMFALVSIPLVIIGL